MCSKMSNSSCKKSTKLSTLLDGKHVESVDICQMRKGKKNTNKESEKLKSPY